MNKILLSIFLLVYTNSTFSQVGFNFKKNSEGPSVKANEFIIEFGGTKIVYNDHVGNEWFYFVEISNEKLHQGDRKQVMVDKYQKIQITCFLMETQEKYNDSAQRSFELDYSDLVEYQKDGFYVPVTITETRGRYAGNKAEMNFYFFVE